MIETPYDNNKELRENKCIVAKTLVGKDFESVLEIGSQWGENLKAIQNIFPDKKLVGIDIDNETTGEARKVTGLDLRLGDILHNSFHDGEFDVVFAEALFCMLDPRDVETALKEVLRIAKKYVILVELKTSERVGFVQGGRTGANWKELLWGYDFTERKITKEEWDANPWLDYGYIYEVKK